MKNARGIFMRTGGSSVHKYVTDTKGQINKITDYGKQDGTMKNVAKIYERAIGTTYMMREINFRVDADLKTTIIQENYKKEAPQQMLPFEKDLKKKKKNFF